MGASVKAFNEEEAKKYNRKIRSDILDTAYAAGSSSAHIGGALSLVDVLGVLFKFFINYSSKNFKEKSRDRFILSKGHGCLVYYSILHNLEIISKNQLLQFEKDDSFLPGHPVKNLEYGIEFSTGSLGMGLSLGIGVALALKKNNVSKVYVAIGDGECNEGSIWEATMAAAHFKLNNLVVILDNNSFQQTGTNEEIMSSGSLKDKFESFNWNVTEIDGHNLNQIYESFIKSEETKDKPTIIICKTVKGKGISFCENNNQWHHSILTKKLYDQALSELKND
jgi:transketolase